MAKVQFKQADAQRLIRAYVAEGLPPPQIEFKEGKLVALPLQFAPPANQGDDLDALIWATRDNGKG